MSKILKNILLKIHGARKLKGHVKLKGTKI